MWACSSVITKYFEVNFNAFGRSSFDMKPYVKTNHCMTVFVDNVVEPVYYIICVFPLVDVCL